jgi:hypothetical protein
MALALPFLCYFNLSNSYAAFYLKHQISREQKSPCNLVGEKE